MNPAILYPQVAIRLKKELRPLWLPTLLTILATYVLFGVRWQAGNFEFVYVALAAYFIGSCYMAAALFGHEFEHHTDSLLLAQPLTRSRLWWEKMTTFAGVVLLTWMALTPIGYTIRSYEHWRWFLMALYSLPWLALCLAPYFTLLSRNFVAGGLFAFIAPVPVLSFTGWMTTKVYSAGWPNVERSLNTDTVIAVAVLALFALVIARRGYVRFQRLGVAGSSKVLDLPSLDRWFPRASQVSSSETFVHHSHPWGLLLRKELRLHLFSFVLAGLLVLYLLAFVLGKFAYPKLNENFLAGFLLVYGAMFALVTGASSIADERFLGTHEWQRTLPGSPRKQFLLKVAVTLGLSLTLGVVLPASLGKAVAASFQILRGDSFSRMNLLFWSFLSLQWTVAAMAASAVRETALRAMLLTVLLAAVLWIPTKAVTSLMPGLMSEFLVPALLGSAVPYLGPLAFDLFRLALIVLVSGPCFALILAAIYPCYLRSTQEGTPLLLRMVFVGIAVIYASAFAFFTLAAAPYRG